MHFVTMVFTCCFCWGNIIEKLQVCEALFLLWQLSARWLKQLIMLMTSCRLLWHASTTWSCPTIPASISCETNYRWQFVKASLHFIFRNNHHDWNWSRSVRVSHRAALSVHVLHVTSCYHIFVVCFVGIVHCFRAHIFSTCLHCYVVTNCSQSLP